jgi:hypothetical protein
MPASNARGSSSWTRRFGKARRTGEQLPQPRPPPVSGAPPVSAPGPVPPSITVSDQERIAFHRRCLMPSRENPAGLTDRLDPGGAHREVDR